MPSSGKRVIVKSESAQDGGDGVVEWWALVHAHVVASAAASVRRRRGREVVRRECDWMFMTATVANAPSPAVASGSLFCRFFVVSFCLFSGVLASMHARRLVGERVRGAGGGRKCHVRGCRGDRVVSAGARGDRTRSARAGYRLSFTQSERGFGDPVLLAARGRDGVLWSGAGGRPRCAAGASRCKRRTAFRPFDQRRRRVDDR